jgi:hypothetical protein
MACNFQDFSHRSIGARNDDLTRRVNIGDIHRIILDTYLVYDLLNLALVKSDDRRDSISFRVKPGHHFRALLHEANAIAKLQSSRSDRCGEGAGGHARNGLRFDALFEQDSRHRNSRDQ